MLPEVFTRIGGIDGVIAIIIHGAEKAGLSNSEMEALRETLGEGAFGKYKKCRDAVVHARSFNAPAGVGVRIERRARIQEVLMTTTALETLAAHLSILAHEVSHFDDILIDRREFLTLSSDEERTKFEEYALAWYGWFRDCRNRRLALPPLPDFPPEAELILAQDAWRDTRLLKLRRRSESRKRGDTDPAGRWPSSCKPEWWDGRRAGSRRHRESLATAFSSAANEASDTTLLPLAREDFRGRRAA